MPVCASAELRPKSALWATCRWASAPFGDCAVRAPRCLGPATFTPYAASIGNVKENMLPLPGSLSTQMRPPCASTMPRAMARPSPVPRPAVRCDCQNRSKTRGCSSSGIPTPVSVTVTSTNGAVIRALTVIRPPGPVNLTAFESRLPITCTTRPASTFTAGSVAGSSADNAIDLAAASPVIMCVADSTTAGNDSGWRTTDNRPASMAEASSRS